MHVSEATNSVDTFSCSWMQSAAVGLCTTPQCLFRLRKTGLLVLTAVPPSRPPEGDTHHPDQKPPLPDPLLGLPWHLPLYCRPVTSATLTDWDKKYLRKSKKYFLFSLSPAHVVHAWVLLYMGRSNRKSLQPKHSRNTTVQSWAWKTHYIALTNLIEHLRALQAFTTSWSLDGRCIFHSIAQRLGHSPRRVQAAFHLATAGQKRQGKAWFKKIVLFRFFFLCVFFPLLSYPVLWWPAQGFVPEEQELKRRSEQSLLSCCCSSLGSPNPQPPRTHCLPYFLHCLWILSSQFHPSSVLSTITYYRSMTPSLLGEFIHLFPCTQASLQELLPWPKCVPSTVWKVLAGKPWPGKRRKEMERRIRNECFGLAGTSIKLHFGGWVYVI